MERATQESGENQKRLNLPPNLYTGIWWYAGFPNHYAGKGEVASAALGKVITDNTVSSLVEAIKAVKADNATLELQNSFFENMKK